MKRVMLLGAVVSSWVSGPVMAACGDTQITGPALVTLIQGSTVCVGSPGNWEAQEQHRGSAPSGQVWDYKLGAGDPVDPTSELGTWTLNATDVTATTVTYDYSGGDSFSYTVHGPSGAGTYSFCGVTEVTATILPSITGCGLTPP